ncbi:MAG TPA: hypothetical protein DCQ98_11890 [Planctomycetaceae bacterium]|nr:hypothetical protein [Planctomycetaceae bacterium]HRE99529.1 hypothetical protein [Pirellulaceae bacterium]
MKRIALWSLASLALLLPSGSARADWNEFWAEFERDRCRNEAWPTPFMQADQQSVRSIFGVMVRQGWEQQVVFRHFHFDEQSNRLNALGERKLQWILSQVPPERANLFVQQTIDPEVNKARMLAIQSRASEMMAGQPVPDVAPSRAVPVLMRGGPADLMITDAMSLGTPVGQLQSGAATGAGSTASGGGQ